MKRVKLYQQSIASLIGEEKECAVKKKLKIFVTNSSYENLSVIFTLVITMFKPG